MKRERRHELQHNELADWLAKTVENVKPYQNLVFGLVTLVLVAVLAYTWYTHSISSESATAWDQLTGGLERGNQELLGKVIDKYRTTTAFPVAAVVSGDCYLIDGCDKLFQDKDVAKRELEKAIERYDIDRNGTWNPSLVEQATFGLARAYECKASADSKTMADSVEKAARFYGEVIEKWPKGAYTSMAKQRLEDLKRPEIKRVYEDFCKIEKAAPISREPGPSEQGPNFNMDSLPKDRPGELPGFDFENKLGNPDRDRQKQQSIFEKQFGDRDKDAPKAKDKESPQEKDKDSPKGKK